MIREAEFRAALARKAKAAGVDVAEVRWERVGLDSTWGDLEGEVFYGAEPAVVERVAKFFYAWVSKHYGSGSYGAQRAIRPPARMIYERTEGWRGTWRLGGEKIPEIGGGIVEVREGMAVATTYYPCAD